MSTKLFFYKAMGTLWFYFILKYFQRLYTNYYSLLTYLGAQTTVLGTNNFMFRCFSYTFILRTFIVVVLYLSYFQMLFYFVFVVCFSKKHIKKIFVLAFVKTNILKNFLKLQKYWIKSVIGWSLNSGNLKSYFNKSFFLIVFVGI